jgi:hypothetical protein
MSESLAKLTIDNRPVRFAVVKADNYIDQLKSTLFISLHTDSSNSPCSVGPSVGFDPTKSAIGMHFFALALALSLGVNAEKFMKDNYTPNLRGYYGYRRSGATYSAGVLEMSELTCPDDEKRLLANAAKLAQNFAVAVQFAVSWSEQEVTFMGRLRPESAWLSLGAAAIIAILANMPAVAGSGRCIVPFTEPKSPPALGAEPSASPADQRDAKAKEFEAELAARESAFVLQSVDAVAAQYALTRPISILIERNLFNACAILEHNGKMALLIDYDWLNGYAANDYWMERRYRA